MSKVEKLLEHFLNEVEKKTNEPIGVTDKVEFIQQGIDRNSILKMPNETLDSNTKDRLALEFMEKLSKVIGV